MLKIGTLVYYTGDMANQDGHFAIVAHRNGYQYDVREIDGDRDFRGVMSIGETYSGNCSERFVTEAARAQYRNAKIDEMQRDRQRLAYLKHQADLSA